MSHDISFVCHYLLVIDQCKGSEPCDLYALFIGIKGRGYNKHGVPATAHSWNPQNPKGLEPIDFPDSNRIEFSVFLAGPKCFIELFTGCFA